MVDADQDDVLVHARNISRSFMRGRTAIEAVRPMSCAIRRRQRMAIMGASGSGKSTLLNLIAGLDAPSAGEIEWPALGRRENLRPGKISMAFQAASLVPFLSVEENVGLPLLLIGSLADGSGRAIAALETFGVADLKLKLPQELSGGQAQRVGLARAIVTEPSLLLADEPTGQLDQATGRAALAALLSWAQATGSALMVATHDRAVAEAFDDAWRMAHGRFDSHGDKP